MRQATHFNFDYRGVPVPSAKGIEIQDRDRVNAAEAGSRALLNALHRYFLNGGRG